MRLKDLTENIITPSLPQNVADSLPHTVIIPELPNQDPYKQYRYLVALAAAKAQNSGEHHFYPMSPWNESLSVIAYDDVELEIIELANKMMNVKGKMLNKSSSRESADVNKQSPVFKFNMTESMRTFMQKISGK